MNQIARRAETGADTRCLMRRLAQAPVSELPATIREAKAAMAGASPEWIAGRVAVLLSHYWRADDPAHMAEAVVVDWIEALSIYPQWAISAAVVRWNRTSKGKRPAPAHIAALCEAEVQPMRDEIGKARSALSRAQDVRPCAPSAEQKARVAALVAEITRKVQCK